MRTKAFAAGIAGTFLAIASSAVAGDYRPYGGHTLYEVATTYTGFYVGGNGGYAWGKGRTSNYTLLGVMVPGSSTSDYDGELGGVQVGYNRQFGGITVFGIEADFQGSNISRKETLDVDGETFTGSSELSWFSTIRGRLGFSFGGVMPYATAGIAFAENKLGGSTPGFGVRDKEIHFGWALGGGLEYKQSYISVRAEYLYLDFGKETYSFPDLAYALDAKGDFHIMRSGINYHF